MILCCCAHTSVAKCMLLWRCRDILCGGMPGIEALQVVMLAQVHKQWVGDTAFLVRVYALSCAAV
jgi:hypothetical protein